MDNRDAFDLFGYGYVYIYVCVYVQSSNRVIMEN